MSVEGWRPSATTALVALLCVSPIRAQETTVVFVCQYGNVKSLIATEHFNKLAGERGLKVTAVSRGTTPDSVVPGPVRQGLRADGFDVARFRPRRLETPDVANALLAVAIDAEVRPAEGAASRVIRWDDLPSVSANYDAGRSAIVSRVKRLVDSLASAKTWRREWLEFPTPRFRGVVNGVACAWCLACVALCGQIYST